MKTRIFCFLVAIFALLMQSCHKDTQLDDDLDAIKAYLDKNGIIAEKKNNVYFEMLVEGTGAQCKAGDQVACKYVLTSLSHPERVIDQSTKRAYEVALPATVPSADAGIIPGFQIALTLLKEGGKGRFYIPSQLAYGEYQFGADENGEGGETNCNLIFEIELCEILSNGNKH